MTVQRASSRRLRSGFTLLEIVIAVAIVALFAAVLGPMVYGHLEEGKITAAQKDVKVIGEALQHFKADTNVWPVSSAAPSIRVWPPRAAAAAETKASVPATRP